jgi:DNA-binding transcriptional ArsR family regulator
MVNYHENLMDAVFVALADPTRRGMIARLSKGPASIGELGRPYDVSKPAITKHVKILERAGLISRKKDGRIHRCRLNPKPMEEAEEWIEKHRKFWQGSLGKLARYLERTKPAGEKG